MKYIHRPGHPLADEFGMVDAELIEIEYREAPHIISDHMQPLKHHGSGKIIDSKSSFRKETKALGCIEIGNEEIKPRTPVKLDRRKRADDIRRAIYELKNGRYG